MQSSKKFYLFQEKGQKRKSKSNLGTPLKDSNILPFLKGFKIYYRCQTCQLRNDPVLKDILRSQARIPNKIIKLV